jgi:hypothetical protein
VNAISDRIDIARQIIKSERSLTEQERTLSIGSFRRFLQRARRESIQILQGIIEQQRSRGRLDRRQKLEDARAETITEFFFFGILPSFYGINGHHNDPRIQTRRGSKCFSL